MKPERLLLGAASALAGLAVLYGCASYPSMTITPKEHADALAGAQTVPGPGRGGRGGDAGEINRTQPTAMQIPGAPGPAGPRVQAATNDQIAAIVSDEAINATLPPQPMAQFLNTLFHDVLNVKYSPGTAGTRTEILTVNAPASITKRQYVVLVREALRNYGLVLYVGTDGSFQIAEDGAVAGSGGARASSVIRSRSSADTPIGQRQVIQYFQLVALQADAVLDFVKGTLLQGQGVTVSSDSAANALVLVGPGRAVATAVELLRNLDQPAFAGSQVVKLEPVFWAPDAFAQALASTLTAEGFVVSSDPLGPKSIMILPLISTNQTLVFAADRATMVRVQYWARELDQPSGVGDQSSTFVYDVRNTSASTIGAMVINAGVGQNGQGRGGGGGINNQIANALGIPGGAPQQGGRGPVQPQVGQAGRGGAAAGGNAGRGGAQNNAGRGGQAAVQGGRPGQVIAGAVPTGGTITVDDSGNRILFTGSASQFAALRQLLQKLDIPAREVVVEVTVAEVTLTDSTTSGVEFFMDALNGAGERYSGGTMGPPQGNAGTLRGAGQSGLSRAGGGLNMLFDRPYDYQVAISALATNDKVNILSRPRLTARSGASASINVGSDVPYLVGQSLVNTSATNDASNVTQQINYRSAGVILNITPVIYGEDRVDIQISQEVSAQRDNPNPAIPSPIFDQRIVQTTLSLTDGQTAVLGGMIEDRYSKGNKGIPFLKDIPILGYGFRTDSVNGRKTELVVLITPFIVRDDNDMADLAGQMTREINEAFRVGQGGSYTLTPFAGKASLALYPPNPVIDGSALKRPTEAIKPKDATDR